MKQTRNILRKGARCIAVCCALAVGVCAEAVSIDTYDGKTVVMSAKKDGVRYAVTCDYKDNRLGKQVVKLSNSKIVYLASENDVKKILWNVERISGNISISSVSNDIHLYCTNASKPNITTTETNYFSFNSTQNAFTYTKDILYGICLFGEEFALEPSSYFETYPPAKLYFLADHSWRTLNASYSFGTICFPKAVKSTEVAGATFYNIAAKLMDGETFKGIVLEEATGDLVAGRPYIYKKTEDATYIVAAMSGDDSAVDAAGSYNGLVGDLTGTVENGGFVVPADMYILQKDQLWQTTAGTSRMLAGRAYINPDDITVTIPYSDRAGVKGIILGMEEGIQVGVKATREATSEHPIFDLQGRRISRPQQGRINVIGGRKVIIK